jgi:hypothetical protein
VDLADLFDTYNSELFRRFQDLGVDLTMDHAPAATLAYHTSNRPPFGFAKRHRESNPQMQTELNMALAHHVEEENQEGIQRCLWAGPDPMRVRPPSGTGVARARPRAMTTRTSTQALVPCTRRACTGTPRSSSGLARIHRGVISTNSTGRRCSSAVIDVLAGQTPRDMSEA